MTKCIVVPVAAECTFVHIDLIPVLRLQLYRSKCSYRIVLIFFLVFKQSETLHQQLEVFWGHVLIAQYPGDKFHYIAAICKHIKIIIDTFELENHNYFFKLTHSAKQTVW